MSYRVMHYINQFFANIGGEEMAHVAPQLREGVVGPGLAFAQVWKEEAKIVSTVICGDSYFAEHEKEAEQGEGQENQAPPPGEQRIIKKVQSD